MSAETTIIHLHPAAPPKPAWGQTCNGCGVCCAYAPCPVGVLVSRRRTGRCAALIWSDSASRYHCGLLSDPHTVTGLQSKVLQAAVARITRRMISAGTGCDCSLETRQDD